MMKTSAPPLSILAASLAVLATTPGHASLVSYWNFDDGATVTDQVGANDGTVVFNAGFSTDTPDGSAHSLDLSATGTGASQDYVRLGDPSGPTFNIASTNRFTISMWVNYSASARGIVSIRQDLTSGGGDRSGVTFGIGGTGSPFVGMIASSTGDSFADPANGGATFRDIQTDQTVPIGQWVHMAAVYDGGLDALRVYVDGTVASNYTVDPAGSINADGTGILGAAGAIDFDDPNGSFTGFGASGNAPQHADSAGDFTRLFYDGLLDDVSIWDSALSAGAVARLAAGESPLTVPEPSATVCLLGGAVLLALRRRRH